MVKLPTTRVKYEKKTLNAQKLQEESGCNTPIISVKIAPDSITVTFDGNPTTKEKSDVENVIDKIWKVK